MKIIQNQPNSSGAYPPVQPWSGETPPDGYYQITADISEFYNGFIVPTVENDVVTSFVCNTDAWNVWKTVPIEQLRINALERISGKCSAAIYAGVTVNGKHYSLSLVSQQNLKTAQDKITAGATSVIFAADSEEPTVHTAEQITAISNAAYEWGVVNTSYYAKLQKWIARETDAAILNAIDYGSMLPNDLMTELATLLSGAGIDLAKYSTMLSED